VKRSSAGLGLFAASPIPKGACVIEYIGRQISHEEMYTSNSRYLFEINSRKTIDGAPRWNKALHQPFVPAELRDRDRQGAHVDLRAPQYQGRRGVGVRLRRGVRKRVSCREMSVREVRAEEGSGLKVLRRPLIPRNVGMSGGGASANSIKRLS